MRQNMNLFHEILQMSQSKLFDYVALEMKKHYQLVDSDGIGKKYIYCKGKDPVLVIAHLDVIHEHMSSYGSIFDEKTHPDLIDLSKYDSYVNYSSTMIDEEEERDISIYYDQEQKVMWSPDGLGADDRVGVYMILSLIKDGFRPYILFTTDEESGGAGASKFSAVYRKLLEKTKIKYMIQLDRCGFNDCVFYDCDNQEFEHYINTFGWETARGTFSDISIICPATGLAGVNLSVGYFYEHTNTEMLNMYIVNRNYDIICEMIEASSKLNNKFLYIKRKKNPKMITFKTEIKCAICDSLSKNYINVDQIGYICEECYKAIV